MATAKICIICGLDENKPKKSDRYNHVPSRKSKGKYKDDSESESDSGSGSDDSMMNSKKRKSAQRKPARAPAPAAPSRRTRNQNPKAFAVSMCKVMELPDTPDHPFLQIFSSADYCTECMTKVKDVHNVQTDLERLQAKVEEAKVDFEIELSKHLQKLPMAKNFRFQYGQEWVDATLRYEQDITLILDYNGDGKKVKRLSKGKGETPKRQQRRAAIDSAMKMKRKRKGSGSEDDDQSSESESELETKKKSKYEKDNEKEFQVEESTSSEPDKIEPEAEDDDSKIKTESDSSEPGKNGSTDEKKEVETVEDPVADPDPVPVDVELEKEVKVESKAKKEKQEKDPNLKCIHCFIPRYLNDAKSLGDHIERVHPLSCDLCEKRFKTDKQIQNHKANDHGIGAADEKKEYMWTCGFCDKGFQLKKYLEEHLDNHPEAKPLNCHQCGRGFKRQESLQKAFQIYKGESVEPCQHCNKNLNLKDYLEHNQNIKNSNMLGS